MKIRILDAPEYKPGSARAKWFAAVKRYDKKSVDDFIRNTQKRPPILTKGGEAEAPLGWVRFFEREGVLRLV
jgi:hypothetical protein